MDGNDIKKLKYADVLKSVYYIIDDGFQIIKKSNLNIKTVMKKMKDFIIWKNLGISVQRCASNDCVLEIINQCIANKISIIMKIKLVDCTIINLGFSFVT